MISLSSKENGSQCHLQLLGQLRLPATAVRLREEGPEVNHDLSEQQADGSLRHLQLLGQLRLPATAFLVKRGSALSRS
jgi:hypothetical protein